MARLRTRDRILEASLRLFNEEGEPNVTTVDIANELDISPGNLYYHFKGKDALIEALYEHFDAQMSEFLHAPAESALNLEDNWYYLYVLFEEIYQFRFFYRNLSDLLQRYPALRKRFRRLLELKRRTARAVAADMVEQGVLDVDAEVLDRLVDSITMTLTYFMTYEDLLYGELPGPVVMHKGVYQVMTQVAPYFGEQHQAFFNACHELYENLLAAAR
ncbi:MAG TPA: TetR/AcrR family transcriptional regulator [Pseudomonadales bacterium]|jgi:AcrR family transcriptional regulator